MSYASTNSLPNKTKTKDLLELIESLGYKKVFCPKNKVKGEIAYYQWYELENYKSWVGVELSVVKNGSSLSVCTRTRIARSYWDLKQQNETIKIIKKRFGGIFSTDEGKNRYMHPEEDPFLPQQSGCHIAFQNFGGNLIKAGSYLMNRAFPNKQWEKTGSFEYFDQMNPRLLSNNLLSPYLVSIMEDYFKSTFIALLKYSQNKERVFKKSRLTSTHLVGISDREISVEEAVAETLSFQKISSVCDHFKKLDEKLDLAGELKRPYRRRKKKLYDDLESLVSQRHAFIHRGIMNIHLGDKEIKKTINDLKESIDRCYIAITNRYDWPYQKEWGMGNI